MSSIQQALLMSGIGIWVSGVPADGTAIPATASGYFTNILAGGGGAVYSFGGAWPPGISINPATGVITGTPATGTYPGLYFILTLPNGQFVSTPTFTLTYTAATGAGAFGIPSMDGAPFSSRIIAQGDSGSSYQLYYSDNNGATWTATGNTFPGFIIARKFGSQYLGSIYNGVTVNNIITSSDGLSWTQQTIAVSQARRAPAYNGTLYVVPGLQDTGRIATSPDGINWTDRAVPASPGGQLSRCVVWTGTRFLLISTSTWALQSTDGITWTATTIAALPSTANVAFPFYRGAVQGLLALSSVTDFYTSDANFGSLVSHTKGAFGVSSSQTGDGTKIIVPTSSGLWSTSDGITWTNVFGAGTFFRCVQYTGTAWYATEGFTQNAWVSPDGVTWSATTAFPGGATSIGLLPFSII